MINQDKITYKKKDSSASTSSSSGFKKESVTKPAWYDTSNFKNVKFPAGTQKKNDDIDD